MDNGFDRPRWPFGKEPKFASQHEAGQLAATYINLYLKEHGESLPDPKEWQYLALGAGMGIPETYLSQTLEIQPTNITLVDRDFSGGIREHLTQTLPGAVLHEEGIFSFLKHTTEADFTLVTAFGIEYALENPQDMQEFITNLPRVMRPNGIAAIIPYTGRKDPSQYWTEHNFTPLSPHTTFQESLSNLLYRYEGRIQNPNASPVY